MKSHGVLRQVIFYLWRFYDKHFLDKKMSNWAMIFIKHFWSTRRCMIFNPNPELDFMHWADKKVILKDDPSVEMFSSDISILFVEYLIGNVNRYPNEGN